MKRIALLVALAVIFAVAAPVMAGPYSDVPSSHWAYDALNKLSATGVITGYPDGTYKGNETLTRYQIAVLVARVLDAVEAESQLMEEQIGAVENGLTAGQAEDVIAIFKSLLAKYMPKIPENLTAVQAEEVAGIVEALSLEFKFELEAMGEDVDALVARIEAAEGRLDAAEGRLDALEVISWNGSYDLNLDRTEIWKSNVNTIAYLDPFNKDMDGDGAAAPDADDNFAASNLFQQELGLGFDVVTDELTANVSLVAVNDPFAGSAVIDISDLNATIEGDDFTATIKDRQEVLVAPYVFGKPASKAKYNGVKLNVGDNVYGMFNVGGAYKVVASQKLNVLDATFNFGFDNAVYSDDFVAGISTPADFFGVDFTTDLAIESNTGKIAPYFALNAKKSLGNLSLEGNYNYVDAAFTGIEARGLASDGFDVSAEMDLLNGNASANARFASYGYTQYGFGADAVFGPVNAYFDMDFANDGVTSISRTQFGADTETTVSIVDIAAGYNYDQYTDFAPGSEIYVDGDGVAYDLLNRIYADLSADLVIPGLTGTASYVMGLDAKDVDGAGLTTHEYNVEYAKDFYSAGVDVDLIAPAQLDVYVDAEYSIFTAGMSKGIIGTTDLMVYVTADPEAQDFMGVNVDTAAGFKASGKKLNYYADLDLSKQITDKASVAYGYLYDNREIAARNQLQGLKTEQTASLEYAITESLSATLEYARLHFTGVDNNDSYAAEQLTTGVSFEF